MNDYDDELDGIDCVSRDTANREVMRQAFERDNKDAGVRVYQSCTHTEAANLMRSFLDDDLRTFAEMCFLKYTESEMTKLIAWNNAVRRGER